jgi:hypothetical protein
MRYAVLGMLLMLNTPSLADENATRFKVLNRGIVIAQSTCGMCDNSRTSCVLTCNGGGICIQACDNQYNECVRANCRR